MLYDTHLVHPCFYSYYATHGGYSQLLCHQEGRLSRLSDVSMGRGGWKIEHTRTPVIKHLLVSYSSYIRSKTFLSLTRAVRKGKAFSYNPYMCSKTSSKIVQNSAKNSEKTVEKGEILLKTSKTWLKTVRRLLMILRSYYGLLVDCSSLA